LTFEFKYDFYDYGSDEGSVDVSNDGGANWTTVKSWSSSDRGPQTFTMDVTALLSGSTQAQIRFVYDAPGWDWWFEVDDVKLFDPTPPCTPIPGTLVGGFVTDANTGEALNGALVESSTGPTTHTMGTPDDPNIPDGFWWNFEGMPGLGPSTRTFTASAPNYASQDVELNLVPDTMNQINFSLGAGWLEMTPDEMIERLYGGETNDQDMYITNHGAVDAHIKMLTTPVTLTWDHSSPVRDPGNLPGIHEPKSIGRAQQPARVDPTTHPDLVVASVPAFGDNLFGPTIVNWPDVTVPDTWNNIGPAGGTFYTGDFRFGDFSTLYVLDNATNNLATVDTTSGAMTVIGPTTPSGSDSWSGLTAALDGTMYASGTTCSASNLYTVDPGTGTTTLVGPITNGACVIDIAINAAGDLYGVDLISASLLKIDTSTGAGTVIGSLGVSPNYAQGLDFDEVTGTLYWASYVGGGALRTIDTTTGASTLIGSFPGGAEVGAFAVASSAGVALPWLELSPTEGTVPGGDSTDTINAHFIADGAPHYGLFKANVSMAHDTPYSVDEMPVYFTKAFWDIPGGFWADAQIHALAGIRVTVGCGFGNFCPDEVLLRKYMAVFLERMLHGADYKPEKAVGIFADVPLEDYSDLADYIEALYNDGVTTGCLDMGGTLYYCPDDPVNRAEMAVFLCRARNLTPVAPTGVFGDVPPDYWAAGYIERLAEEGITLGCGYGNYCPEDSVTRAQIAVFLVRAWNVEYVMN